MKKKALGRGLSALLTNIPVQKSKQEEAPIETPPAANNEPQPIPAPITGAPWKEIEDISIELIAANKKQPRTVFDQEKLQELADSIKEQGVLQPLLVRRHPEDKRRFQVIAGERRLRAADLAGLESVPCIILDAEEKQVSEIALVENLQRTDLSVVEEANAYRQLMLAHALTQEEIAKRVGKSRESVANALRLLNLPDTILAMVQDGQLSSGHAKVLLSLRDENLIQQHAMRIIEDGLSVRDIERIVREKLTPRPETPPKPEKQKDIFIVDLEHILEEKFHTKVTISMQNKNKGSLKIDFYDLDQLDGLLKKWDVQL
jgi:ParB family transcriptional regulator, chromosome partitioning protein